MLQKGCFSLQHFLRIFDDEEVRKVDRAVVPLSVSVKQTSPSDVSRQVSFKNMVAELSLLENSGLTMRCRLWSQVHHTIRYSLPCNPAEGALQLFMC